MPRAQIIMIAPMLALILIAILPTATAIADMDVIIITDEDINLDLTTSGEGALLSVEYNGRDLLKEIEHYIQTIADLKQVIVALAMRNDIADLNDQLIDLEYDLDKLVNELNLVLNDLYSKVVRQAHIIGINPLNTTVAITLISGNMTVVGYIEEILIDLNATDQELSSIQLQFDSVQLQLENIYAGMLVHDTVIMGTRSTLREMNATLSDAIVDMQTFVVDIVEDMGLQLLDSDAQLQGQIDVQSRELHELSDEIASMQQEIIKERKSRETITIMFGVFSLIVIALNARAGYKPR